MKLETLKYAHAKWTPEKFPALDSDNTLVVAFGAPSFRDNPAPIAELGRAYPNSVVIGCSTAGEIFGDTVMDESLSVGVLKMEHSKLARADAKIDKAEESFDAGKTLSEKLKKPDLRGVFVLSEGIQINGSELVRGLNSGLPETVVVTGGLAGDHDRFEKTWVIKDGKPESGWITAVGLYGDKVSISHGSKGGWDTFGPERVITKAVANVLYELDGKPALKVYEEYLGERAKDLPASGLLFPLAIRKDNVDQKSIVRTILGIDRDKQSLIFAGDMTVGYRAQLMKANFERLIGGAADAAKMTQSRKTSAEKAKTTLTIAISCVGRRLVLGERTEQELEATRSVFGEGVPQIGFYSYGEISPYTTGHCDLHNQTMTLTTISEA
jgi:hypothetical protein